MISDIIYDLIIRIYVEERVPLIQRPENDGINYPDLIYEPNFYTTLVNFM